MRVKGGKQKTIQRGAWSPTGRSIVLVILLAASLPLRAGQAPLLAAASSLRSLWPELVENYTKDTGQKAPRVSFASSGLLSTQIINGAPFELFLSADRQSIERLPAALLTSIPQVYATGELHLVVAANSPLSDTLSLETLATGLQDRENPLRVAIPNPAHAPYGRAAKAALESAGMWPVAAQQLLAAENAAQTLQFVLSGAVDIAIVPQSLVYAYHEGIVSLALPQATYQPVEHTIVSLKSADADARAFLQWMLGERARTVLEAAGLSTPSDDADTGAVTEN